MRSKNKLQAEFRNFQSTDDNDIIISVNLFMEDTKYDLVLSFMVLFRNHSGCPLIAPLPLDTRCINGLYLWKSPHTSIVEEPYTFAK